MIATHRQSMIHRATTGLLMCVVSTLFASHAVADQVVLLDGTVSDNAKVTAIDDAGAVTFGSKKINLQELRHIIRDNASADAAAEGTAHLFLHDGSVLVTRQLRIESERVLFDLADQNGVSLPLGSVRGAVFVPLQAGEAGRRSPHALFAEALANTNDREDALYVIRDDNIITVRGVLESLNNEGVAFQWGDQTRTVNRDRLYGLSIATPLTPPEVTGQALVYLKSGSQVWGTPTLRGDTLTLTREDGLTITAKWSSVLRLNVRSARMAFLSDVAPASVKTQAIVTLPWPPRMDASVLGGPLILGDRTFEKGIGMHADCQMTWQLGGRYDVLAAVIGIDASVGQRGDCIFRIVGDGKTLFTQRVRGGEDPREISIPITGIDRLELIADHGEGLDIADRANWADVRVIRNAD